MEGFKKSSKMQCFKEGGSVQYKSRHSEKAEMSEDIAQDKKIVKKAFAMHDKQEHPGEKTNLSKLKKGGRAKKDCGTVKKYKTGGTVENAYGAKKTDKDMKDIANTKRQKPAKLCGGKSVSKYAPGGTVAQMTGQGAISDAERAALQGALPGGQGMGSANDMERRRMMDRAKNAMKYLGPAQQSEFVKQGGMNPGGVSQGAPAGSTIPGGMKKGGKIKKMNTGGTCS
jgi:hypothetical protein